MCNISSQPSFVHYYTCLQQTSLWNLCLQSIITLSYLAADFYHLSISALIFDEDFPKRERSNLYLILFYLTYADN